MVRKSCLIGTVACVFLGLQVLPVPAGTKELKGQQSWDGTIADAKLLKDAPANGKALQGAAGFVTDQAAWAKLWKAWRGEQKVPTVDFTKDLVLVFTLGGPNKISSPTLRLNDQGDLKADAAATLIGGDGFCYKFVVISRAGIKTINGTALKKD